VEVLGGSVFPWYVPASYSFWVARSVVLHDDYRLCILGSWSLQLFHVRKETGKGVGEGGCFERRVNCLRLSRYAFTSPYYFQFEVTKLSQSRTCRSRVYEGARTLEHTRAS
jgi:hypothetical protein